MTTLKVLQYFLDKYNQRKALVISCKEKERTVMFHIMDCKPALIDKKEFFSRDVLQVAKYAEANKFVSITENGIRL